MIMIRIFCCIVMMMVCFYCAAMWGGKWFHGEPADWLVWLTAILGMLMAGLAWLVSAVSGRVLP
jgi:hypothetical protein